MTEQAPVEVTQADRGWQPIESAPKDGTDILVCVTHSLPDGWKTVQWVDWTKGDTLWPHFQERIDIPFPPTHWMPLPAPPGETAPPSEREAIVKWLQDESGRCDCFARSAEECGCGGWDDCKTRSLHWVATAIERGEHIRNLSSTPSGDAK